MSNAYDQLMTPSGDPVNVSRRYEAMQDAEQRPGIARMCRNLRSTPTTMRSRFTDANAKSKSTDWLFSREYLPPHWIFLLTAERRPGINILESAIYTDDHEIEIHDANAKSIQIV
jgi:hypothetical protein